MGPTAQDFYATFGLGRDERHIATLDSSGVALVAIQGLNQQLRVAEETISSLERDNGALTERVAALEELVRSLLEGLATR